MNGVEFNEVHEFFGRAAAEIGALVAHTPVPESAGSPLSSYPATCGLRPEADVRVAIRVERRCR